MTKMQKYQLRKEQTVITKVIGLSFIKKYRDDIRSFTGEHSPYVKIVFLLLLLACES